MTTLGLREFHPFEAAGQHFLYMVPSAGVFHVDAPSWEVLRVLDEGPMSVEALSESLADRFPAGQVADAVDELQAIRAIGDVRLPPTKSLPVMPPENFPLTTMVLNVTNKCNLACTYCYEYGEDKIVDTEFGAKSKFMSEETARESVDFMFNESGINQVANLTFFGGETLLNFKVLKKTLAYAREKGAVLGKEVRFSLTTNATLLRPEIIEWLVDNEVGVTISIDGPKESQDKFRVFSNGMGSYDLVLPKIKELLKQHTARLIGARVTLTRQNLNVKQIFQHLTEEMGFWSVGFAPVTTADGRDYAIEGAQYDDMAHPVPGARRGLQGSGHRESAPRLLEHPRDYRGDPQGDEQGVPLWCRPGPRRCGHRRRRGSLPSLCGIGGTQHRVGPCGSGQGQTASVPRDPSHREQDRLSYLLGPAAVLGRLLPRSSHSLRHDHRAQPALL